GGGGAGGGGGARGGGGGPAPACPRRTIRSRSASEPERPPLRAGTAGRASREREGARGVLDEETTKPAIVHALGAQARHDVHQQMVIAVAAVLHERALVGDVGR